MKRSVLQIPIDPVLRKKAELVAREEGFSSLQEYIRILVSKIVARAFTLQITETASEEDGEYVSQIAREQQGKPLLTPAAFERRLYELKHGKKKV